MSLYHEIALKYPTLKRNLAIARIDKTPDQFIEKIVKTSVIMSIAVTFGLFMVFSAAGISLLLLPVAGLIVLVGLYQLFLRGPQVEIHRRSKEIDKDVLFAGRFLLIKLNSGKPLMNAIAEASTSYGVANQYFKEIVREIELGTPLEDALDHASRYCPSHKMRRILFQISNALKIGVDVTNFLEAILDEIAQDQLTEIQKYGKKLSGITMFYMLFAVVIPSLGITMFITVVSLVNIQVDFGLFMLFLFALCIVEFMFISVFKSIRPTVNI